MALALCYGYVMVIALDPKGTVVRPRAQFQGGSDLRAQDLENPDRQAPGSDHETVVRMRVQSQSWYMVGVPLC